MATNRVTDNPDDERTVGPAQPAARSGFTPLAYLAENADLTDDAVSRIAGVSNTSISAFNSSI